MKNLLPAIVSMLPLIPFLLMPFVAIGMVIYARSTGRKKPQAAPPPLPPENKKS